MAGLTFSQIRELIEDILDELEEDFDPDTIRIKSLKRKFEKLGEEEAKTRVVEVVFEYSPYEDDELDDEDYEEEEEYEDEEDYEDEDEEEDEEYDEEEDEEDYFEEDIFEGRIVVIDDPDNPEIIEIELD